MNIRHKNGEQSKSKVLKNAFRKEKKMYNYYAANEACHYTDLASERRRAEADFEGVEFKKIPCEIGMWDRVKIKSETGAALIGRPMGTYDTLNTDRLDLFDEEGLLDVQEAIAKRLCSICDEIAVIPARILVVGFGNERLTPDSFGPKCATRVKPTLHISRYDEDVFETLECSEIAVFCPGVPALCGMESAESTRQICEAIRPDLIFALDAISTKSHERLGASIQLSNTGIFPGGVGNLRMPITRETMGVPVIGIGVPTVMDLRAFGISVQRSKRAQEAPLFVSPREIDEITDNAAEVIGGAINQAFGLYTFK